MMSFSTAPSIINRGAIGENRSCSVGVMVPGLAALKLTKQGRALSFPSAPSKTFLLTKNFFSIYIYTCKSFSLSSVFLHKIIFRINLVEFNPL